MENFLWHHVSEHEAEEIKKEAKKIIDSFGKAIASAEEIKEIPFVERKEQSRDELQKRALPDKKFRDIMFENAPEKEQDYLKAERGKWK
jgi:Asp-tRNA(Asn)/Glu-tRNA(Gln) amidotransferase C subunit